MHGRTAAGCDKWYVVMDVYLHQLFNCSIWQRN